MRIVIDVNGNEVKVVEVINEAESDKDRYDRIFDEYCAGWAKDARYNLIFLQTQQTYANDVLRAKGYLLVNDVYSMLGMPSSIDGMLAGWVLGNGSFVDFGLKDEENADFVAGKTNRALLKFNVQYDDIRGHLVH